jgi:hypothetical protein
MKEKSEKFYYCQSEIEFREKCQKQCNHCKTYYYPLEQERKMEDLKEWVENNKNSKPLEADFQQVLNTIQIGVKESTLKIENK